MSGKKKNRVDLDTLELFVGAGGLALGLSAARFSHRAIVEWNHYACETLRANLKAGIVSVAGWPEPIENDVRDIDFTSFHGVDVVSGGVPCQPFSMGGAT
jgi:DNA (cytosine-5)-methyltransferase 1